MNEKNILSRMEQSANQETALSGTGYVLPETMQGLAGRQYILMPVMGGGKSPCHEICLLDPEGFKEAREKLLADCKNQNLNDRQTKRMLQHFLSQAYDIELEDILYIPDVLMVQMGFSGCEDGCACKMLSADIFENGKKIVLRPVKEVSS